MPSRSLAAPIFTGSAFALKYRAYGVTAFALAALRAKASEMSAGKFATGPGLKVGLKSDSLVFVCEGNASLKAPRTNFSGMWTPPGVVFG